MRVFFAFRSGFLNLLGHFFLHGGSAFQSRRGGIGLIRFQGVTASLFQFLAGRSDSFLERLTRLFFLGECSLGSSSRRFRLFQLC